MKLKGWTHNLPSYLEKAIQDGTMRIQDSPKKDYEFLIGCITNPEGTEIVFCGTIQELKHV